MKSLVGTPESLAELTRKLRQREAELALINTVQKGIMSKLHLQDIFKLVGERIHKLLDAQIVAIATFKHEDQTEQLHYLFEAGEQINQQVRLTGKLRQQLIDTGELILINENLDSVWTLQTGGASSLAQDDFLPKSVVYIPIVVGEVVRGYISLQNVDREHAFSESDVRLLRTLAINLSVTMQNAEAFQQLQEALTELKAAREQLFQQEKLASLGQLAAGIAHEIKNPLNFVNNFSELNIELLEEVSAKLHKLQKNESLEEVEQLLEDVKTNLQKIHQHGTRADNIVKSMLQHSRGGSGKVEPADLNALLREYVNLAFHGMRAGKKSFNVSIDLELDEKVGMVPLMGEDFSRVILNLCNNAFDAMREKLQALQGKEAYRPALRVRTGRNHAQVWVEIADNGPGIPEEHKEKILQPFFTTKKGTEGTGLGLSITHDIVKAHGGKLEITSAIGSGTTITIELPVNL